MDCEGCRIGHLEAIRMFQDRQKCLEFLENHGVTVVQVRCTECNAAAVFNEEYSQWYCRNGHSFERFVSADDWLENIRLSPGKRCIYMAIYLHTNPPHEKILTQELNIPAKLAIDWSIFIREVLQDWCLHNSVKVGGPSSIIEMDEAELERNKYSRRALNGKWIFSGIEKITGNIFFEVVSARTSSMLIGVIKKRIRRGTKILLDYRMACECLQREGFNRLKGDYELSFIDPVTGNYSQNPPRVMPENSRPDYYQSGFIADFLFRKHFPEHHDRIHHFLVAVSSFPLGNRTIDDDIGNDDDDTQMASIVFFISCFIYAFIASYFFYRLLLKYHLYPLFR